MWCKLEFFNVYFMHKPFIVSKKFKINFNEQIHSIGVMSNEMKTVFVVDESAIVHIHFSITRLLDTYLEINSRGQRLTKG